MHFFVQLLYFMLNLSDLSRDLFIKHDWKMPRGLVQREERNTKNSTPADWQQAKRFGKDSRKISPAMQDEWAISASKAASDEITRLAE